MGPGYSETRLKLFNSMYFFRERHIDQSLSCSVDIMEHMVCFVEGICRTVLVLNIFIARFWAESCISVRSRCLHPEMVVSRFVCTR